ncbi:MAG: flagellar hook-length control protein FliK [Desulfomicrobiaceae bacterium]
MQFFPIALQHGGVFSVLAGKGASAKAGSLFSQLLGRSTGAPAAGLWEHILALREKGGIDDDLWQRLTDWKKSGEDGRLGAWLAQVCPELLPAGWISHCRLQSDPGAEPVSPETLPAGRISSSGVCMEQVDSAVAMHDDAQAAVSAKQGAASLWAAQGKKFRGTNGQWLHGRQDAGAHQEKPLDAGKDLPVAQEASASSRAHGANGWAEKVKGADALGHEGAAALRTASRPASSVPVFGATGQEAMDAVRSEAADGAQKPGAWAAHGGHFAAKDGLGQSPRGNMGHGEPPSLSPAESLWQATSKKVGQSLEAQGLAGEPEARRPGRSGDEGRIRSEHRRSSLEAAWVEDPQELSPRAVPLRGSGFGAKEGRPEHQSPDERRGQRPLAAQGGQSTGAEGAGAAAFSPAGPVASRAEALAPSIVEQTAQAMVRQLSPGIKQLTIQIEPQDLGPIHVALQVRGGEVHAVLRPAHPETSQILNAHLPGLRQELERQGFQVARLDVQAGLADLGSHNAWDGASQHQRPQGDGAGTGFWWRRSVVPEESLARNLQEERTPGLHTALRADGAVDLFA